MKKKVFDTYGAFAYFAYTAAGRLASRVWARGVETAYAYDVLGQLSGIVYSDATPDVAFAYDRLGRVVSAVTAVSSNLFEYAGLDLFSEVQNGVAITRSYDGLGRSAGFNMGSAYIAAYGYDTFGRCASVSSSVASVSSAIGYSYVTGSDLLASMTNSAGFWWRRAYEQNRDLIASVENGFGGDTVSDFAYGNDADGRRERRVDSGAVTNLFGLNARSEVVSAVLGGSAYAYGYDAIGNRVWSAFNAVTNTYAANNLNQYTAITGAAPSYPTYDADGNMTRLGDWLNTWDAENRLVRSEPYGIATNGAVMLEYGYNHRSLCVTKITKQLSGRGAGYPLDPSQAGTWDAVETRRYVWDGYNIAAEIVIDEVTPSTNVTYYTWGLDLSGTLQGAGGVGGLLAETKMTASTTNTYYAFGDANGNVTEYADAAGTVRGHYEYSPFGGITIQSGDMADSFTHRFSTKPFDVETKLIMYELRPYDPGLGRWLTRDPIGEIGGVNIYVNSGNNCVMNYDCFGLSFVDWLPFAGTLKTIIENMARAIPGQDANNYPASVTLRRCCEAGDAIAETECEQINNDMFYQYSRDFSVDAFKGKVLEVVAVVIIKNPAISLAALVDGLTAGINWVDVLNDMRKARDAANEKNCDCSKTGYIP